MSTDPLQLPQIEKTERLEAENKYLRSMVQSMARDISSLLFLVGTQQDTIASMSTGILAVNARVDQIVSQLNALGNSSRSWVEIFKEN